MSEPVRIEVHPDRAGLLRHVGQVWRETQALLEAARKQREARTAATNSDPGEAKAPSAGAEAQSE